MPIRFTCPKCGTHLAVPDDFAGRKGKCKKCGVEIVAPQALSTAVPPATQATQSEKESEAVSVTVDSPVVKGRSWLLKVSAVGTLVVVVGLSAYTFWPRDNWERDNAPRLAAIKAEAEAAVSKGDHERSFARCEEIVSVVGTRTLHDPSLRAILDYATRGKVVSAEARARARAERETIFMNRKRKFESYRQFTAICRQLKARLSEGLSYNDYREKHGALIDAYATVEKLAELDKPGDDVIRSAGVLKQMWGIKIEVKVIGGFDNFMNSLATQLERFIGEYDRLIETFGP